MMDVSWKSPCCEDEPFCDGISAWTWTPRKKEVIPIEKKCQLQRRCYYREFYNPESHYTESWNPGSCYLQARNPECGTLQSRIPLYRILLTWEKYRRCNNHDDIWNQLQHVITPTTPTISTLSRDWNDHAVVSSCKTIVVVGMVSVYVVTLHLFGKRAIEQTVNNFFTNLFQISRTRCWIFKEHH